MAQGKADTPNPLAKLTQDARTAAESVDARGNTGTLIAGPFEVGKIGQVSVVEREMGENKYLYAEFTGTGRPSRVPLAAVSVLAEKIA